MARITVEDCIDKFSSRFELVLVASNRARKLFSGETPTVEIDNDKNTVIALREIANETIPIEGLKNDLIEEYQEITFSEDEDLDETQENDEELIEDKNVNNLVSSETEQITEDNSGTSFNEVKNEENKEINSNNTSEIDNT